MKLLRENFLKVLKSVKERESLWKYKVPAVECFPEEPKVLVIRNENEEDFFLKTVYTYGHDISIQMVNHGLVDGASVHSLIFNYLSHHYPEKVENVKIVGESEHFGMPPVVTPVSLSNEKYNRYQQIFLNMHKDSIGKSILDKLEIDKFVVVEDTIYNSVFRLCKQIENEQEK